MENPNSWGPVEHTIYEAYLEWTEMHDKGYVGWSLPMYISDALRKKGLINNLKENSVQ